MNHARATTPPPALWPAAGPLPAAAQASVRPTGFRELDAALPGGGWPCGALTDCLCDGPAALAWRLLAPALVRLARQHGAAPRVALIGPPEAPHAPGLGPCLPLWVDVAGTAERLWAAEQVLAAQACAAVLVWLPDAREGGRSGERRAGRDAGRGVRPEALRRLHLRAAAGQAVLIACRPTAAAAQPCAAPVRLTLAAPEPWALQVDVWKRPGPPLARPLRLPSVPPLLAARMAPAWRHASVPATAQPEAGPLASNAAWVAGDPDELIRHVVRADSARRSA